MDDKLKEVKEAEEAIETGTKLAANMSSGNVVGAIKNVAELAENGVVKKIQRRKRIMGIIKAIMPFIFFIIMVFSFFSIVSTVRDKMAYLMSEVGVTIRGFWQWIRDDYWIDLEKELEYTDENGEVITSTLVDQYIEELGNMGISLKNLKLLGDADYSDEEKLLEDPANKALVYKYISEFVRADLITQEIHKRNGTELVKPGDPNKIDGGVYLYRTTSEVSASENDFEIESTIEKTVDVDSSMKNYKQMKYKEYDDFMELKEKVERDSTTLFRDSAAYELRYVYTIDKNTQELLIAKITTTNEVSADVTNPATTFFSNVFNWVKENTNAGRALSSSKYEVEIERIPYKDVISKYTMPYEFLINLCMVTQNPEFVYHVALMARETNIVMAIQDNTETVVTTVESEQTTYKFKNEDSDETSGASQSNKSTKRTRTVTTVTTVTPKLLVEYADTWSFYEEFTYTKNIKGEKLPETVISETYSLGDGTIPSTLSEYQEEIEVPIYDEMGQDTGDIYTIPGYWYDTFPTSAEVGTQVITTTTIYNDGILEGEKTTQKSKQFLGLLRNGTGECSNPNCFQEQEGILVSIKEYLTGSAALECVNNAVFDRKGINVTYKIPNIEREEAPLNKLTSGIEMLYGLLGGSSSNLEIENGDTPTTAKQLYIGQSSTLKSNSEKIEGANWTSSNTDVATVENVNENGVIKAIAVGKCEVRLEQSGQVFIYEIQVVDEIDYSSLYKTKMQGVLEHLQYLMTFPENEKDIKSSNILDWLGDMLEGTNDVTSIYGDSVQEKVWFALRDMGYSEIAVAGAMGNIHYESGSFNPTLVEGGYTEYNGGIGLCQWTNNKRGSTGRNQQLRDYAASKGLDWRDEDTQVEFLIAELTRGGGANGYADYQLMTTTYTGTRHTPSEWINATDIKTATIKFCFTFERPNASDGENSMSQRVKWAEYYYNLFSGKEKPAATKEGWSTKGLSCPRYRQGGQSWSNMAYNYKVGGTIQSGGCGACALAMAASGLLEQDITPDIIVSFLNANKTNTVYNGAKSAKLVAERYGLTYEKVNRTNKAAIDKALDEGKVCIFSITNNGIYTGNGHFIMCNGREGDKYYVLESGSYYQTDRGYTYNQVFSAGSQGVFILGK